MPTKKKKKSSGPLNKPRRIKKGEAGYGKKKFVVKVKSKKGNEKTVKFGDANSEIKRDDPKRRKAFRDRHGCDKAGAKDKTKAKYWSCKFWKKGKKNKVSRLTSRKK